MIMALDVEDGTDNSHRPKSRQRPITAAAKEGDVSQPSRIVFVQFSPHISSSGIGLLQGLCIILRPQDTALSSQI